MDYERIFDLCVFGSSEPRLDVCLGLFISPESLYLSEVRMKGGSLTIQQIQRIPIPQANTPRRENATIRVSSSINTELLGNPDRLAGVLKPVMAQLNLTSKNLVVSLSTQFGLMRYFTIPPMDRRFWNTAIPAEARKSIPIPINELVYDFQVRPLSFATGKQGRLGVLFGVMHRNNFQGVNLLAEKLGLNLLGIELSPCSVERLRNIAPSGDKSAHSFVQVHLEDSEAYVLSSHNGWPVLFRAVQLSPDASTIERRKMDLSGSVDFAVKQLEIPLPKEIHLTGSNRDLKGWSRELSQEMNVPVQIAEQGKKFGLKSESWGSFSTIGAALRFLAPSPIVLNMCRYGKYNDEDRRAFYALFGAVGLAAACFLLIGSFQYLQSLLLGGELKKLRRQVKEIVEFRNRSPEQIESLIHDMEAKAETLRPFEGAKLTLADMLRLISEDVPDSVWLDNLSYDTASANPSSAEKQGNPSALSVKSLSLRGHATGGSASDEQEAVNQFRQKLQGDARFNKSYSCSAPVVQIGGTLPTGSGSAPGGSGSNSVSGQQDSRTAFSLTCVESKR